MQHPSLVFGPTQPGFWTSLSYNASPETGPHKSKYHVAGCYVEICLDYRMPWSVIYRSLNVQCDWMKKTGTTRTQTDRQNDFIEEEKGAKLHMEVSLLARSDRERIETRR